MFRGRQCFRDGADQCLIARRKALVNQCAVAADEVHADRLGCFLQDFRIFYRISAGYRRQKRDGCDRDPFVNDRDAVGALDLLTGCHQMFGTACDLIVDLLRRTVYVVVGAIEEGQSHRDRADVEIFVVDHPNRFQNIFCI